jgi:hypothetical protein
MSVAERYAALWSALHGLREAWIDLRVTVQSDRPRDEGPLLLDRLDDELDDGLVVLDEAVAAVAGALQEPDALHAGGDALAVVHERVVRAGEGFWTGAGSCERRAELRSLGRRRGGEWPAWLLGVEAARGRVPAGLSAVQEALRHAWQALVERAARGVHETRQTEGR